MIVLPAKPIDTLSLNEIKRERNRLRTSIKVLVKCVENLTFKLDDILTLIKHKEEAEAKQEGPPPGWDDHDQPCDLICPDTYVICKVNPEECDKAREYLEEPPDPDELSEPPGHL